jgi:transglutaminase-like putative cysteine protease
MAALSTIQEVDLWIRGHFRYRPELEEVLRTVPYMANQFRTLGYFEGDCDDVSIFYATVLKILGFQLVRFVAIRHTHPSEFEHVFVEFYEPQGGQWLRVDPTVDQTTVHHELERMILSV